jgi:hypothetical protein
VSAKEHQQHDPPHKNTRTPPHHQPHLRVLPADHLPILRGWPLHHAAQPPQRLPRLGDAQAQVVGLRGAEGGGSAAPALSRLTLHPPQQLLELNQPEGVPRGGGGCPRSQRRVALRQHRGPWQVCK